MSEKTPSTKARQIAPKFGIHLPCSSAAIAITMLSQMKASLKSRSASGMSPRKLSFGPPRWMKYSENAALARKQSVPPTHSGLVIQ